MELGKYLPFWDNIEDDDRETLMRVAVEKKYSKGENIVDATGCSGLLIVKKGKLRVYTISDEGREITMYRLYDYDICLLSSACIFRSITFSVFIDAEDESEIISVPSEIYKKLMKKNIVVSNLTNEWMADRFSEVMWLLDQVLNRKMDCRIAAFLLEESRYSGKDEIAVTHEGIAKNLGTAREVVGRLINYLQKEGILKSGRGVIKITDMKRLKEIAGEV